MPPGTFFARPSRGRFYLGGVASQLVQHRALERPGRRPQRRSGLALRMRVLLSRRRLDERLSEGIPPSASPELSLRADQLRSDGTRRRIARGLEGTVEMAEEPPSLYVDVPLRRKAICAEAPAVLLLAQRLRSSTQVNPQGAALALRILDDRCGPLYGTGEPGEIWRAATRAFDLLD